MKALIVGTNGKVTPVETPADITCAWIASQIGCEWVECVRPRRLEKGFVIVCDEEGALKRNYINVAASWMYEADKHGDPILGTVMIIREVMGPEGPEFAGISDEDADTLVKKYGDRETLIGWYEEIRKKL